MIDSFKLKEIRHYVAHEIYRAQKKSDELFSHFEKLQKLRKDLIKTDAKVNLIEADNMSDLKGKKSLKEVDMEYEVVRKQLKNIQSKYDVLKKIRSNL